MNFSSGFIAPTCSETALPDPSENLWQRGNKLTVDNKQLTIMSTQLSNYPSLTLFQNSKSNSFVWSYSLLLPLSTALCQLSTDSTVDNKQLTIMSTQLSNYPSLTLFQNSKSNSFVWSYSLLLPFVNCPLSSVNWLKWRISDSNRWPPACKAGALASWANPPTAPCHRTPHRYGFVGQALFNQLTIDNKQLTIMSPLNPHSSPDLSNNLLLQQTLCQLLFVNCQLLQSGPAWTRTTDLDIISVAL